MSPTDSISYGVIALIILVIAVMRIGFVWTLLIAIAGGMVGIVGTLSGILDTIADAVQKAASAFL